MTQVEQKAPAPPGSIPKNRQTFIMLAIAGAIVLTVIFSGTTSSHPKPAPVRTPDTTINQEIEGTRRRLQQEEEQLRRAKENAAQSRTQIDVPVQGGGAPSTPVVHEKSRVEQDREWREYNAPSASNIALSNRKPSVVEPAKPVVPKPVEPSPAVETFALLEGTFVEAALTNRLEGSFAGPVNCIVTNDVYSGDNRHLLVPRGTRVLGEARPVDKGDQQRLAVSFHRMILPNEASVSLDKLQGLEQAGSAGLPGSVNHHYMSVFGTSIALGLLSGLSLYGTNSASAIDVYRQGVASEFGRDATRILDRSLNRLPSITVPEGTRMRIYISQDLRLPEYLP